MNQQGDYNNPDPAMRGSANPSFESTRGTQAWERPQMERDVASGSVAHLLRQLTTEVTSLFSKEVSLARAEVRENVHELKAGIIGLVMGGVVLLAGAIILLWAAVYGLSNFMDLWLAALIVGGIVSVIGMSMVSAAKSKLGPDVLKTHRTANSLKEDRAVMMNAVKGGR